MIFTEDGTPLDICPRDKPHWISSPETDLDGNGCQDSIEDTDKDGIANSDDLDNDNDGIDDFAEDGTPLDICPRDKPHWISSPGTDLDGNGCQDSMEDTDKDGIANSDDPDNDNDGIDDFAEDGTPLDMCPRDKPHWISSPETDIDEDGCQDIEDLTADTDKDGIVNVEDSDDDNDGIYDFAADGTLLDLCPRGKISWQSSPETDFDEDGCHDSMEDIDDDNDGLIEIGNRILEGVAGLLMLHNIRYDLDGSHYNDGTNSSNAGCPNAGCKGYELLSDLDFDIDGDGSTFSDECNDILDDNLLPISFDPCTVDFDDKNPTYFHADDTSDATINEGWLPIGTFRGKFTGIFKGNGFTIKNLYINREVERVGLFATTSETAIIHDIALKRGFTHSSASASTGGLVGVNHGSIISSYTTGNVTANFYSGGLVGVNLGSIISSYTTRNVAASASYSGGLVGYNHGSIISSYTTGNVTADYYSGGLVGVNHGSIISSYTTGNVTANSYSGGLVGDNHGSIISSYTTGNVAASASYSGGLVGYNRGSIISSYTTGNVASNYSTGGLVGFNLGSIISSYATGNITGNYTAGGLVGFNRGSIISSYATGNVSSFSFRSFFGSLVGYNIGSIISSYGNTDSSQTIKGSVQKNKLAIGNEKGSVTGLTQAQFNKLIFPLPTDPATCEAFGASWNAANAPSCDYVNPWDSGSNLEYPGLVIAKCVHRPEGTAADGFTVEPNAECSEE